MGRKYKKKKNPQQKPDGENVWKGRRPKKERPTVNYEELVRENKEFETYYKSQKIVSEGEWDAFMSCMKENLPAAFRITGSKDMACALLAVMKKTFFEPLSKLVPPEPPEGELEAVGEHTAKPLKPICLPWYPDNLAWQLNLTRSNIRRCEAYWQLHQFLISETETGNISRQEAVSMIPPLVLDVQPHHKVLDLCAAPGSKTAQLIEFLHGSDDKVLAATPTGLVVANDVDNKRCYMLTHQAKRLQSPAFVITNHDAAFMPNIHHTQSEGSVRPIKFDRVLCDVPCSGDGTLRKNFDVWAKWNPVNGANLHGLQLRIARRGLEMLEVGGRLVYSTCSLNPLENEAVIQRLLLESDGAVQLVDISQQLPGLKFKPGLEDWVLMNREMEVIKSASEIPIKNTNLFNKHLFPPSEEAKGMLSLTKCIRILPHHQDTGGFFVAALEKVKPLPGEKVITDKEDETKNASNTQRIRQPPKKRRCQGYREEPYFYFEDNESIWPGISDFYGMRKEVKPGLFFHRAREGKKRNIYITSSLVKDIITLNQHRLKIINTGVKVLVRSDNKGAPCDFRLAQEGCRVLLPLFTHRRITVTKNDLVIMMQNDDMEMPPEIVTLHPSTQQQCTNLCTGAIAFLYSGDDGVHVELVGWKGNKSVRAYVAKNDRIHYLRLLGADTSRYEKNKFQEQRNTELKNSEEKMEESATEDKTEPSLNTSENGDEDLTEEKTECDAPEDSCADDSSISEAQ